MPKMNDIRETIRRHIEKEYDAVEDELLFVLDRIMNDLTDHRLLGLPTDNRTSVDTKLIEDVGKKFGCRPGDDADDICKTVLR